MIDYFLIFTKDNAMRKPLIVVILVLGFATLAITYLFHVDAYRNAVKPVGALVVCQHVLDSKDQEILCRNGNRYKQMNHEPMHVDS